MALDYDLTLILFLIFGGCCSNVITLEAVVKHSLERNPAIAVTFVQFVFVAIEGLAYRFYSIRSKPTEWRNDSRIPITTWIWPAFLHFTICTLSNLSLAYRITIPLHIVLRSGGGLITLLIGTLWGKRYTRVQYISVVITTVGTVLAARGGTKSSEIQAVGSYRTGILLLCMVQLLSSYLSLHQEGIYRHHPAAWRDGFFYMHAFSLPLFAPALPRICAHLHGLGRGSQLEISFSHFPQYVASVPFEFLLLLANAITQFWCVRGVNMLTSRSSALSASMILNFRKLLNLLLSIYIFGIHVDSMFIFGTSLVFGSILLYSVYEFR